MNVYLRNATEDDSQKILDILNHGVKDKVRRGDLGWGDANLNSEEIINDIKQNKVYLAEDENKTPLGTIMIDSNPDQLWGNLELNATYIKKFAVAAGFKGQHIGSTILDIIARHADQKGHKLLRLTCPANNPGLRSYYERHGFNRADHIARPSLPQNKYIYYERPTSVQERIAPVAKRKPSPLSRLKKLLSYNND